MQHVVLSWTAAARAETYEVYYNTTADFATAEKFTLEPTESELMVTGLRDGKTYNFWVVARNTGGAADPSRIHTTTQRTSDPIPEYLRVHLIPGGPTIAYSASNLWPGGDYYTIQDLGEDRLAHERYLFAYGAGSTGMGELYPGGTLKFVRNFNPPEDYETAGPNANYEGCLIYEYETTQNGERVKKYQAVYYQTAHLGPQTYLDYQNHPSHPPAANMGTANSYTSGVGEDTTYTLERAIVLYAHRGGGPVGTGGRSDYLTPMGIYYGYDPTVVGN
jgi:hypothetical protein